MNMVLRGKLFADILVLLVDTILAVERYAKDNCITT